MSDLTKEQKQERISHLTELLNHPGWKIIVEELNGDIAITEEKLFGATLEVGETIQSLQRERVDRLELRDLPQNLITEYAEDEGPPTTDDE